MIINEMHVVLLNTGHLLNGGDCWCEPRCSWYVNDAGLHVMLVLHEDRSIRPRDHVLQYRTAFRDPVTVLLDDVEETYTIVDDDEDIDFDGMYRDWTDNA